MRDKPPPFVLALQQRIATLEAACMTTTASLVAAVSLLERGGKKAAPSDTMFKVMLSDYNKSIEAGRTALRAAGYPVGEEG